MFGLFSFGEGFFGQPEGTTVVITPPPTPMGGTGRNFKGTPLFPPWFSERDRKVHRVEGWAEFAGCRLSLVQRPTKAIGGAGAAAKQAKSLVKSGPVKAIGYRPIRVARVTTEYVDTSAQISREEAEELAMMLLINDDPDGAATVMAMSEGGSEITLETK